jgi:hypothetical protein
VAVSGLITFFWPSIHFFIQFNENGIIPLSP